MAKPNHDERVARVLRDLSALILSAKKTHELQRHYPDADADRMDSIIERTGQRVEKLRELREDFEDLMGVPL